MSVSGIRLFAAAKSTFANYQKNFKTRGADAPSK